MKGMRFSTGSPWLDGARRVPSPNFDDRPTDCDVDVVIVHAISLPPRCYGGGFVEALFTNRLDACAHPYFREVAPLKVSAHFLIERGGAVVQFVAVDKRAWHAGASRCLGRERVNDFSVGVELEGCDEESFTLVQYERLAALIRALSVRWPVLGQERVFAHCDVSPGRKTDPGPCFDWGRFRRLL
jgi:AmpD protein